MKKLENILLLWLIIFGFSFAIENKAVMIYHNGEILTMEGATPHYVQSLVVNHGNIVYMGDFAKAQTLYPLAKHKNLKGKVLLPGFIDGHLHFAGLGAQAVGANLLASPDGEVNDIDALISTLKVWAKGDDVNRTGWIFGMGYDNAVLKENRHPTKFDLDKVSTTVPIIVIHISGHFAVMNSLGLRKMGITAQSKDPKGGIIRRVKGSKEPNGVLEELAAIPMYMSVISPKSEKNIFYFLEKAQAMALRFGYTTAQEGRAFGNTHENLMNYAEKKGFDIDIVSYLDYSMNAENVKGFSCTSSHNTEEINTTIKDYSHLKSIWANRQYRGGYRVAGMKITLDGSPQGRTAWSNSPYLLPPSGQNKNYQGYPAFSNDKELENLFALAFKNDWQVLVHANGDAAIDQLIRTMKPSAKKYGNTDRRHVLVHGVFLQKRQYKALKALHIIPSMFTMHTFYWGDWYKKIIGKERANTIAPLASLIAYGFKPTIHTDAPVALANQMQIIWASVNRLSRSASIIGKEERVSPYQALKAITLWSAYQHFEEHQKGSLKVGKLADMVILSDNPLSVPPLDINKIKVLETIKAGETVYKVKE